MRLIPIECVRDKSVVAKTIYDNNGNVLVNKGVSLTSQVLRKLRELEIWSIYIEDEYSSSEIRDIIKPELRQKSITFIKEAFVNIKNIVLKESKDKLEDSTIQQNKLEYINSLRNIAEELVENIYSNEHILLSLVDIKSFDNYMYQHSINVAVISVSMGMALSLPKEELLDIAEGALLHDIGKIYIPKDIYQKHDELTDEERELYNSHPIKGYEYVKKEFRVNDNVLDIIKQHHERIDGNGFPNKLKGNEISKFAKIISIADCYDYLTSDTIHTRAIPAADALEFIMSHINTLFDYDIVLMFSKILIAYPAGTIVKLSNGDIAVVESTPENYPLRPVVKIIKSDSQEKIGSKIELLDELSIVISNVEYDV